MSPSEIALVQSTFRKIVPISDQAAALFYARLFEISPGLRPMFHGDMQSQGKKLMAMIAIAVAALGDLETLLPTVRSLGARHRDYGATEEDYASVGSALLWTLQKGLGEDFTPAVSEAWTNTYSLLATAMIEAHRSVSVAA